MTKNRRAKQAARERQRVTGEPYTLALRNSDKSVAGEQAIRLLLRALKQQNWVVGEIDQPEYGGSEAIAGPLGLIVDRDAEKSLDGSVEGPQITVAFPYLDSIHPYTGKAWSEHLVLNGSRDADALGADLVRWLAEARATAVRRSRCFEDKCRRRTICGGSFPRQQVMERVEGLYACPACVLDDDLTNGLPLAATVAWLDHLWSSDPACPAGWSAVMALIAALAPEPDTIERLRDKDDAPLTLPLSHWRDPADIWFWLPSMEERPAPRYRLWDRVPACPRSWQPSRRPIRASTEGHQRGCLRLRVRVLGGDKEEGRGSLEPPVVVGRDRLRRRLRHPGAGTALWAGPVPRDFLFEGYPLGDLLDDLDSPYSWEQVLDATRETITMLAREIGFQTRDV